LTGLGYRVRITEFARGAHGVGPMIHCIRIQNFKSLRDVTVDLSPVTVFIGKSGTGKTNFASAIRFLRDYLASGHVPQ